MIQASLGQNSLRQEVELDTRKEARLDKALCNAEWRLKFQEGAVWHLIQAHSDHMPLLISIGGFNRVAPTRRPFRFQATWVSYNEFDKFLHEKWCPH